LFLLGLLVKRANKKGTYIGIAACVLYTGYAILTSTTVGSGDHARLMLDLGKFNYEQHKYMIGVYSHVVLFVVGFIASYFFPHEPVDERYTIYGWSKNKINQRAAKAAALAEQA
jgi:SSS family solute:Na+ symporter